jgi:hypothetical protein
MLTYFKEVNYFKKCMTMPFSWQMIKVPANMPTVRESGDVAI